MAAVRRFNRFYTRQIGVLQERLLESEYSLTEVRVLFELTQHENPTATDIARDLGVDAGYLSRILRSFRRRRLIAKEPSRADGRQRILRLTTRGWGEFASLDARSSDEMRAMLKTLSRGEQRRLLEAMQTIRDLLDDRPPEPAPLVLRSHRPGDMGWVVHRHGALYAEEYGWDERFEALVAEITAHFVQHFDPKRERCWMAELGGEIVGSVFLVAHSRQVAKLRLLLVEPTARGHGVGRRLVDECIQFARNAGYRRISLWTQSNLTAARRIYQRAGFELVRQEAHRSFGHDLIGETWELNLRGASL